MSSSSERLLFLNEIVEGKESFDLVMVPVDEGEDSHLYEEVFLFSIAVEHVEEWGLIEGQFYRRRGVLEKANDASTAKRLLLANNRLRYRLRRNNSGSDEQPRVRRAVTDVFSYHVNVGHGNCSFICFVENRHLNVWVIDCSHYDCMNKKSYVSNIDDCLDFIKKKYDVENVVISKAFITHPHYDHYCGIPLLMSKDLIAPQSTSIYLNLYYSWPDSKYNALLDKLLSLRYDVREPRVGNGGDGFEFIYPNVSVFRTRPSSPAVRHFMIVPEKRVNNASSVIQVKLNNDCMVFPGDLETKGWNQVTNCGPYLGNCTYFCVSHHGSENGHLREICPLCRNISSVAACVSGSKAQILMGRHGSYPGVFSQAVLSSLPNVHATDSTNRFLGVEWATGKVSHH